MNRRNAVFGPVGHMHISQIERREFITMLGGAAVAWPLAALAQQPARIAKIGHIESGSPSNSPHLLAAFIQRLRELGYVEGQNLFIERRYAEGSEERLPQLAAELVQYGVDVIFAIGPPQALAAAKATDKIPIVFVGGGDPVALGLIKSFARPGGNVTGLTFITVELAPKRIQLLKDAVPSAKRMAVLWNPNNVVNKLELNEATATAASLGLTLMPVELRALNDFEGAFATMARERIDAALVLSNPLTFPNRIRMSEFALKSRIPIMVSLREYAEAGALMSYGPSYADHCRRAATYVDQILKGAKPADLPVQLPTTFELTINLRTAKVLGLSIPPTIRARADVVIE
ncbi:MAG: ABC transporter substrate-binding protein [Pseudomonadota bacterium]